jgi:signal transduction histidine kinase
MMRKRIFSTYTFRYSVTYVTSLSVTMFLLLGLIYASFSYDYFNDVHGSITDELANFEKSYRDGGPGGLEAFVAKRTGPESFNKFYYLLVDADYNKVGGNLEQWPKFRSYVDGWLSFELDILNWHGRTTDDFVGRSRDLDNGHHLLVARHYNDVIERIKLVAGALSQSMFVMIVLSLVGGAIISYDMLKRIDSINESVARIMDGDLTERIPVMARSGHDFDRLVRHLNRMLDRIQLLMEGVRQVSDNIAHDLRTPLTRLRNNLAELEQDVDARHSEQVEGLIYEADALLSTFNALLRIAQVESGNRRAGFTAVELNAIVNDVIDLYEPLAADKEITVNIGQVDTVNLVGDRDLLFQMMANVVDNAIKYTPDGGTVSVSLRQRDGDAELIVADSGIGIPLKDRQKVFQRFFRVEESRGQRPGNGLGLSLVAAVVKLHYGDIELQENFPGLRVVIRLPTR